MFVQNVQKCPQGAPEISCSQQRDRQTDRKRQPRNFMPLATATARTEAWKELLVEGKAVTQLVTDGTQTVIGADITWERNGHWFCILWLWRARLPRAGITPVSPLHQEHRSYWQQQCGISPKKVSTMSLNTYGIKHVATYFWTYYLVNKHTGFP